MSFRVQQIGGEDPRHSCICLGDNMSELSLFIDESGDFGPYKPDTSFYIVSMVLHDQSNPITEQMLALDSDLVSNNLRTSSIHTRPLLRHEDEYRNLTLQEQRYLLSRLYLFARNAI